MFIPYNPNPMGKYVGDCTIRAIAKATNQDWDTVYMGLVTTGYFLKDVPSSNEVWGRYLTDNGFKRRPIPDTCPDCYTVREFCLDHKYGTYILGTGSHVIACIDGNYYDTGDSGSEVPIIYYERS